MYIALELYLYGKYVEMKEKSNESHNIASFPYIIDFTG